MALALTPLLRENFEPGLNPPERRANSVPDNFREVRPGRGRFVSQSEHGFVDYFDRNVSVWFIALAGHEG
jgi:hypothetical protein